MENPHHVLVVDDQKGVRQLLQIFFQEEGFKTTAVSNGQEAVNFLHSQKPDLIVMDVKMPIMSGLEALSHIKKLHPGIPVIMMTAYADEVKRKKLVNLGAKMCLFKPLDLEQLLDTVNRILNNYILEN